MEDEEEKMNKFYELIRSFKDHACQLAFNTSTNMPKNTKTTQHKLSEKIELKKHKKKKIDDKGKEEDKSCNHKDLLFANPSQATPPCYLAGTIRNSPNVMTDYKLQRDSGDQIHDDTQDLDLNLSL